MVLIDHAVAYGVLFGVAPSLVAETFGSNGVSQNWGLIMLSPVIFGNIFNILYGRVYDQHSQKRPSGHLECLDGRRCYQEAYFATLAVSVAALGIILWCIRRRHRAQLRRAGPAEGAEEEHEA